jgi:hypothetical protein
VRSDEDAVEKLNKQSQFGTHMKLVELRTLSPQEHKDLSMIIGFREGKPVLAAKKNQDHVWMLYKYVESSLKQVTTEDDLELNALEDVLAHFLESGLKPFCMEPKSDAITVSKSIQAKKDEVDRRRHKRKDVKLPGEYKNSRTGNVRKVEVVNVSFNGLLFRTSDPNDLQLNDFLSFTFTLNNSQKTKIKRKAKVRHMKKNSIGVEFINPPAFDMEFDFYLLSEM